jgi:hypothetical protein
MNALELQTPSFLSERAVDHLEGKLPDETIAELRLNLRAFRSWVAEPAFRAPTPEAAVEHVLHAVGPSVQLKATLIAALAKAPGGVMLLARSVIDALTEMVAAGGSPTLVGAAEHLQKAQRVWMRFLAVHPEVATFASQPLAGELVEALNLGFHADNLLTVRFMATDGDSAAVPPPIVEALESAAADVAQRYHQAVRELLERQAPSVDPLDPFRPTDLDDLLNLPPFEGPEATVDQINHAIRSLVEPE